VQLYSQPLPPLPLAMSPLMSHQLGWQAYWQTPAVQEVGKEFAPALVTQLVPQAPQWDRSVLVSKSSSVPPSQSLSSVSHTSACGVTSPTQPPQNPPTHVWLPETQSPTPAVPPGPE